MGVGDPIKVLLVDDHEVFREGLSAQLQLEPDMVVVGEACDAETAVERILETEPDIVLSDINMPGLCVFSAAQTVQAQLPHVRFLFLSAFSNDILIEQAIQAKAWGYMVKGESFSTISQAVREVNRGWLRYSSEIRARLVDTPEGPRLAEETTSHVHRLTGRELELLRYIACGMSVKEIAKVMHISSKTVDCHKTNLMSKLDLHNRVDLARFAYREGLAIP